MNSRRWGQRRQPRNDPTINSGEGGRAHSAAEPGGGGDVRVPQPRVPRTVRPPPFSAGRGAARRDTPPLWPEREAVEGAPVTKEMGVGPNPQRYTVVPPARLREVGGGARSPPPHNEDSLCSGACAEPLAHRAVSRRVLHGGGGGQGLRIRRQLPCPAGRRQPAAAALRAPQPAALGGWAPATPRGAGGPARQSCWNNVLHGLWSSSLPTPRWPPLEVWAGSKTQSRGGCVKAKRQRFQP